MHIETSKHDFLCIVLKYSVSFDSHERWQGVHSRQTAFPRNLQLSWLYSPLSVVICSLLPGIIEPHLCEVDGLTFGESTNFPWERHILAMLIMCLSRHRLCPIIIVTMVMTLLIQHNTRSTPVQGSWATFSHRWPLYVLSTLLVHYATLQSWSRSRLPRESDDSVWAESVFLDGTLSMRHLRLATMHQCWSPLLSAHRYYVEILFLATSSILLTLWQLPSCPSVRNWWGPHRSSSTCVHREKQELRPTYVTVSCMCDRCACQSHNCPSSPLYWHQNWKIYDWDLRFV